MRRSGSALHVISLLKCLLINISLSCSYIFRTDTPTRGIAHAETRTANQSQRRQKKAITLWHRLRSHIELNTNAVAFKMFGSAGRRGFSKRTRANGLYVVSSSTRMRHRLQMFIEWLIICMRTWEFSGRGRMQISIIKNIFCGNSFREATDVSEAVWDLSIYIFKI